MLHIPVENAVTLRLIPNDPFLTGHVSDIKCKLLRGVIGSEGWLVCFQQLTPTKFVFLLRWISSVRGGRKQYVPVNISATLACMEVVPHNLYLTYTSMMCVPCIGFIVKTRPYDHGLSLGVLLSVQTHRFAKLICFDSL